MAGTMKKAFDVINRRRNSSVLPCVMVLFPGIHRSHGRHQLDYETRTNADKKHEKDIAIIYKRIAFIQEVETGRHTYCYCTISFLLP